MTFGCHIERQQYALVVVVAVYTLALNAFSKFARPLSE